MSSPHGITTENLLLTLPSALQGDESMAALASSIAEVLAQRTEEIRRLTIYSRIDELPGDLLDILAHDFKVGWWSGDYSIWQKRAVLTESWHVHRILGTKSAIVLALEPEFGRVTGRVEEWFDYDGSPYHFRITGVRPETIENGYERFLTLINVVKRQSTVLDSVVVSTYADHNLYAGIAIRIGHIIRCSSDTVDLSNYDVFADEHSVCLLDERGCTLVEE